MVPKVSRVAVLTNPDTGTPYSLSKSIQAAAQGTKVTILLVEARTPQEIERAFATMTRQNAGAVIVSSDGFFIQQQRQIVDLALKHRLPSIYPRKAFVETGGLMSYGPNTVDFYRRAATYVDKIFKGAKPADLPVEQPTTLELVINRKTAKTLGLAIPQELLLRADKVIE
jgi:putative ABC transport system substrate-binding protein